jgi:small subunit ribosomal protein S17
MVTEMQQSEQNESGRGQRARRVGVVVSARAAKTVVVAVERMVRHPLYRKTLRRTTRFLVHDEQGCGMGDTVRIVETRPLSKRKRWRVEEIVTKARAGRGVAGQIEAEVEKVTV